MVQVKFKAVPTQYDHGATISIMLKDTVIARTPGNTEPDKYMADYIVSALDLIDTMGCGPHAEEAADPLEAPQKQTQDSTALSKIGAVMRAVNANSDPDIMGKALTEIALIIDGHPMATYLALDDREVATTLAALRAFSRLPSEMTEPENDIATSSGEFNALSISEIDELCERLNCGG